MPAHQQQERHRDDGEDACALMMMETPLQQGQKCQLENGNEAIATREIMLSGIKGDEAFVTRGRRQLDDSKDTCALTTASMPSL